MTIEGLLDSNVLVAAAEAAHVHHAPSAALFASGGPGRFAVAAHTHSEVFSTLTRRGSAGAYQRDPEDVWRVVESFARATVLVGLTPAQTLDAIRAYARSGGIGPRLYDRLIGQSAIHSGIGRIITWNVAHMRGLFPALEVVTPEGAG